MNDFDKAFEHVLGIEGNYSDHPNDRGGATKYGITRETLSKWREQEVTKTDVKNLQLDEAKDIYESYYWDRMSLYDAKIPGFLKMMLFDQGVNRGVFAASRDFQKVLFKQGADIDIDGIIGPVTVSKLQKLKPETVAVEFIKLSQLAYVDIVKRRPSQIVFLKGWLNRSHRLLDLLPL